MVDQQINEQSSGNQAWKIKDPEKNDLYVKMPTVCQSFANFCLDRKTAYTATYRVFRCLLQNKSAFSGTDFKVIFCGAWRILDYCITYRKIYYSQMAFLKSPPEFCRSAQAEIIYRTVKRKIESEFETNSTVQTMIQNLSKLFYINVNVYPYILVGALAFSAKLFVSDSFGLTTVSVEEHAKYNAIPWVVSLHADKKVFDESNVGVLAAKLIKAERDIEWLMTNYFLDCEKPRSQEYTNFVKCIEECTSEGQSVYSKIKERMTDEQFKIIQKYAENERLPFHYSLYDEISFEEPSIWSIFFNPISVESLKAGGKKKTCTDNLYRRTFAEQSSSRQDAESSGRTTSSIKIHHSCVPNSSKVSGYTSDDKPVSHGSSYKTVTNTTNTTNTSYGSFLPTNSADVSSLSVEKSVNASMFNMYMKSSNSSFSGNSQNIHGRNFKIKNFNEKSMSESSGRVLDPNMSLSSVLSNVSMLKGDQQSCGSFLDTENSFMYNPTRKATQQQAVTATSQAHGQNPAYSWPQQTNSKQKYEQSQAYLPKSYGQYSTNNQ